MFHIGVATQHPPLPEPGQLSDLGINFIKQCLTIDAIHRPSAKELMLHPWMVELRETLLRYEAAENETPVGIAYEAAHVPSQIVNELESHLTNGVTHVTPHVVK